MCFRLQFWWEKLRAPGQVAPSSGPQRWRQVRALHVQGKTVILNNNTIITHHISKAPFFQILPATWRTLCNCNLSVAEREDFVFFRTDVSSARSDVPRNAPLTRTTVPAADTAKVSHHCTLLATKQSSRNIHCVAANSALPFRDTYRLKCSEPDNCKRGVESVI